MGRENLIFTLSGIRGITGKDFNFNIIKKIAIAYGLWFNGKDKKVIIGKDTRPSGNKIENAVIGENSIIEDYSTVHDVVLASKSVIKKGSRIGHVL